MEVAWAGARPFASLPQDLAALLATLNPFSKPWQVWLYGLASVLASCSTPDRVPLLGPESSPIPAPLWPRRPGLLPWARGDSGQALIWWTDGDPARWPVLLADPNEGLLAYLRTAPPCWPHGSPARSPRPTCPHWRGSSSAPTESTAPVRWRKRCRTFRCTAREPRFNAPTGALQRPEPADRRGIAGGAPAVAPRRACTTWLGCPSPAQGACLPTSMHPSAWACAAMFRLLIGQAGIAAPRHKRGMGACLAIAAAGRVGDRRRLLKNSCAVRKWAIGLLLGSAHGGSRPAGRIARHGHHRRRTRAIRGVASCLLLMTTVVAA